MASANRIHISQVTRKNVQNILEFVELKYIFEVPSVRMVKSMMQDLQHMELLGATDDKSEDALSAAKVFLQTNIQKHNHILEAQK